MKEKSTYEKKVDFFMIKASMSKRMNSEECLKGKGLLMYPKTTF